MFRQGAAVQLTKHKRIQQSFELSEGDVWLPKLYCKCNVFTEHACQLRGCFRARTPVMKIMWMMKMEICLHFATDFHLHLHNRSSLKCHHDLAME